MFIKKQIVSKVIDTFTNFPETRDDRWQTIKLVTTELKKEFAIIQEWEVIQLAFDVDRAFRYVQQHIPSLRGKTWLERQLKSGEITKEQYNNSIENLEWLKEIAEEKNLSIQLQIFNEKK